MVKLTVGRSVGFKEAMALLLESCASLEVVPDFIEGAFIDGGESLRGMRKYGYDQSERAPIHGVIVYLSMSSAL